MSRFYKISIYALGKQDHVDITKEQFDEIKRTQHMIAFGLAVEEKLDLLAENYADLERELIDMAIQHSIFSGSLEQLLSESRHKTNRRLINLLTSIRLYHDQIAHALSSVYGKKSTELTQFRSYTNDEYDSTLSYRALEALRNHVQHASLPITAISFPMSAVERDARNSKPGVPTKISFKVVPYIGIESLEENKDFKRSVLAELKLIANKKNDIEVVPLVREYVSSIGRIHKNLREMCKADIEAAESTLEKYRSMSPKLSEGLAAIEFTDEGLYTDHVYLVDRPVKRWRKFLSKNGNLERVSYNFVTSEHG